MTSIFAVLMMMWTPVSAVVGGQGSNITLTSVDNNKTVVVPAKGTLTIKLPAQLGTGYSWEVSDIDKDRLSMAGKPIIETIAKDGVGREDLQVFTFTPSKEGTAVLKLRYARPWEKDAKPLKSFAVTVTIE
jgi:predicted secreted protein